MLWNIQAVLFLSTAFDHLIDATMIIDHADGRRFSLDGAPTLYTLKPGIKKDPVRRWALPDRVFFGNGACAILAGVFLSEAPLPGFYAERIIPGEGFAGNHIFVTDGVIAFDHHGYSLRSRLLTYHTNGWAGRSPEGWNCRLASPLICSTGAISMTTRCSDRSSICTTRSCVPRHILAG